LKSHPPNITVRERAASYAITWLSRSFGIVAGACCCQTVPFHSHVWSNTTLPNGASQPPNSTQRPRAMS
jgi:hypothetical protein